MVYFTSDQHFGHKNILELCKRPFENVHEMNMAMINNWMSVVKPEDTIYHLGDYGMANSGLYRFLNERLTGNIILIRGNHDNSCLKYNQKHPRFTVVGDLYETEIEGQHVVMSHYPLLTWHWMEKKQSIQLHGHTHGNLGKPQINQLDVGVDSNNFKPISWTEVLEKINAQNKGIFDNLIGKPVLCPRCRDGRLMLHKENSLCLICNVCNSTYPC